MLALVALAMSPVGAVVSHPIWAYLSINNGAAEPLADRSPCGIFAHSFWSGKNMTCIHPVPDLNAGLPDGLGSFPDAPAKKSSLLVNCTCTVPSNVDIQLLTTIDSFTFYFNGTSQERNKVVSCDYTVPSNQYLVGVSVLANVRQIGTTESVVDKCKVEAATCYISNPNTPRPKATPDPFPSSLGCWYMNEQIGRPLQAYQMFRLTNAAATPSAGLLLPLLSILAALLVLVL
eukprot:TRINITY_DN1154_c0_g1_i1.p1 TRINITY_DN1154_c0_g1~~TRINITY_DN1154_c0_g1_i1.p1  ORF type:complete len:242 (-),score=33.35 TRINITY_DN1154_c0_g1_i1:72-767(-)